MVGLADGASGAAAGAGDGTATDGGHRTDAPLDGRVALVTGGTDGIGRETARGLASRGATVLVTGRDREKGARVASDLASETGATVDFHRADFADFGAVRDLAGRVLADHDRLDVLVNNAGTWQRERRLVSVPGDATGSGASDGSDEASGVELTFAVNHLAHFLLTGLLVDRLRSSAPARVVSVSSGLHRRATPDFEAAIGPDAPVGVDAYALSKLANAVFAAALARRLDGTGVTSNAVHPGMVPGSRLAREASPLQRAGFKLFGLVPSWLTGGQVKSVRDGARTSVYVATSPAVADVTGNYFADCEPVEPATAVDDGAVQDRLWELSVSLTGLDEETFGGE